MTSITSFASARERVTTRDQILGWSRGCSPVPVGDTEETRDCGSKNNVFYGIKAEFNL